MEKKQRVSCTSRTTTCVLILTLLRFKEDGLEWDGMRLRNTKKYSQSFIPAMHTH